MLSLINLKFSKKEIGKKKKIIELKILSKLSFSTK
jgi:hypothetical protein